MSMLTLEERKAKAEFIPVREARRFPIAEMEIREIRDGILEFNGYASVTEHPYDMGFYQETIRATAFDKTLSESPDVQLLINHTDLPIARTRPPAPFAPSLWLNADRRGLRVKAELDATDQDVVRLESKVVRGLLDQMSFAFSGARSEWDEDYENRVITELSLHRGDVSIVNQGANPATSFQLRDAQDLLAGLDADELAAFMRSLTADAKTIETSPSPVNTNLFAARATALRLRAHN